MSVLAFLLAAQTAVRVDTVPPYLAFPEPGLDDPAAYQGYATRLFRDAAGNAFQVYLNARTGRVVHLWADAADENVGLTVRDSAGRPTALAWGSASAVAEASGRTRSVAYALEAPSSVAIGLFLLGSMRVERDFQYAGRDSLPLNATPFPQSELLALIANLELLTPAERRRQLALLGARSVAELRARLAPPTRLELRGDSTWTVSVVQPSFDGRTQLSLVLEGDGRQTVATRAGGVLSVRSRTTGGTRFTVRVTTDAPALTPLTREEIFNADFRRFYDAVRADTAHPVRFRRLEREVRGVELLCTREKLMAGLPNFATYFGRDMLMTALLMQPIWSDTMAEHVVAAALRKLGPQGDASHEEALGGQAIRENAAEYNRLLGRGQLARARAVLTDLARVRENYFMVDDDFQLPVVAARYFANPAVSLERKRAFLAAPAQAPVRGGETYGTLLARNLAYVWRRAESYAREPVAANLVGFQRDPDGWWHPGSWRDSRVGYAGGRFALDVNAVWVPEALKAIAVIRGTLDSARGLPDSATLDRAIDTWRGAARHFEVALAPAEAESRVRAKLASLPEGERTHWDSVLARSGFPADTLRFLAVSLDADGRPIPVMSTDPGMLLLLEDLPPAREAELLRPFLLPYPVGLFVEGLGPLAANDAYASPTVWQMFERDLYHSSRVVWGREVNVLLAALARRGRPPELETILAAVDRSGLRHAELWSYRIERGALLPTRYGTSSDVQLWSLTDLAVQYLLNPLRP